MATSIQRLIMFTLALNLVLTLCLGFYNLQLTDDYSEINKYSEGYQNLSSDFMNNYGEDNPNADAVYMEQSFGDTALGGLTLIELFKTGIGLADIPEGINEIEKLGMTLMMWAIRLINILLCVELFFMFYGRKTS
jgi:hypothetical protein